MRDYGKVQTKFWTNPETQGLSDTGKLLFLYLLTGPHTSRLGCFRVPDGYIADDLGWVSETISIGFGELYRNGLAYRCQRTGWTLLPGWLKYNGPLNPKMGQSFAADFEDVPESISLYGRFLQALLDHPAHFPKPFLNRIETLSKRYRDGMPNHIETKEAEAELEAELEPEAEPSLGGDPPSGGSPPVPGEPATAGSDQPKPPEEGSRAQPPPCPYEEIVAAYHEILPELPRVRDISPKQARFRFLAARLREDPERREPDWWRGYFERVRKQPLLMGFKTDWRADFEWLVRPENMRKVLEGRHEPPGRGVVSATTARSIENLRNWRPPDAE